MISPDQPAEMSLHRSKETLDNEPNFRIRWNHFDCFVHTVVGKPFVFNRWVTDSPK
jgi:hypothetical protein